MKTLETYKELKEKYGKYVVMIKVGIFYEVYDNDSYVIHNLCGYRVMGKNRRVGFPINSINNVIEVLKKNKVNYIIVDDGFKKKKFNRNNYDKYIFYENTIEDRINEIHIKLLRMKKEKSIKYLIEKIEDLL